MDKRKRYPNKHKISWIYIHIFGSSSCMSILFPSQLDILFKIPFKKQKDILLKIKKGKKREKILKKKEKERRERRWAVDGNKIHLWVVCVPTLTANPNPTWELGSHQLINILNTNPSLWILRHLFLYLYIINFVNK